MGSSLSTAWSVIRRTFADLGDDELTTRAAALAFYSVLSFAPVLVLLLWVVSALDPALQDRLVFELTAILGQRAGDAVHLVIDNIDSQPQLGNIAGLIGLGVSIFAASAVFAQLQNSLNRVWGLRPAPNRPVAGWLWTRLHALGLLLALAFLMIVSMGVSGLIAALVPGNTLVWQILQAVISLAVFAGVFAALFKILPDAHIGWRDARNGAILTAILFVIGKFFIALYIAHSRVAGAYGPAGALVMLLIWVYYASLILLLGAEFTQAMAVERGEPIRPNRHAQAVEYVSRASGRPGEAVIVPKSDEDSTGPAPESPTRD